MITQGSQRGGRALNGQPLLLVLLGPLVLSSCAAAPFLIPIAFEFARNLFQTGLQNYGSKHRDNLSNLVNRLSSPYMQGLPPMQMGGPGMAGFGGPGSVPGQPGYPGQPGFPPSAVPGQPGAFDPLHPSGMGRPGMPAAGGSAGAPGQPGCPGQPDGPPSAVPSQPGANP